MELSENELRKSRMELAEKEFRKSRGDYVIGLRHAIEALEIRIDDQAKRFFPDFHWMKHKVSTFWRCERSPLGMCIFKRTDDGRGLLDCVFCHNPAERK